MLSSLADNLKTRLIILWTIVASAAGSSILGLDAQWAETLLVSEQYIQKTRR